MTVGRVRCRNAPAGRGASRTYELPARRGGRGITVPAERPTFAPAGGAPYYSAARRAPCPVLAVCVAFALTPACQEGALPCCRAAG
jgi:hypothetical protein